MTQEEINTFLLVFHNFMSILADVNPWYEVLQ